MVKSWKIQPSNYYIRRRDKSLVQVLETSGQGVKYVTHKAQTEHKVSLEGFRQGFRPPTEGELPDEVAATSAPAAGADG